MCSFVVNGERLSWKFGEVDCDVRGGLHQLASIIVLFIKIIGMNMPLLVDTNYYYKSHLHFAVPLPLKLGSILIMVL